MAKNKKSNCIKISDISKLNHKSDLLKLLEAKTPKSASIYKTLQYETELRELQIELVRLQKYIQEKKLRVAILFEGRDAAGKGGSIQRFMEHLNPRAMRLVALPKPTDMEKGQWYLQRYVNQLPNEGEMVFFDRSWYNRAVVEPVNKFCNKVQYERFMRQVPDFEHMLHESGIKIIKFWFSISKVEQQKRFEKRALNPLKQWKVSPVDQKAQSLWDQYTIYKKMMFQRTHAPLNPWVIVQANDKKLARLNAIKYVLGCFKYPSKMEKGMVKPDDKIIQTYSLEMTLHE
jgi:polyphosphate kinase 2